MKLVVLLLVLAQVWSQTDIDQVNEMLKSLRDVSRDSLRLLEESWQQSQQRKSAALADLKQSKKEQITECGRRERTIKEKEDEIIQNQNFLNWVKSRLVENNRRITLFEELKCRQFDNFIRTVKDQKIQLTVSAFLRQQIQRILDENASFFQKTQAMGEIVQFIERINTQEIDVLTMQREAEAKLDEQITALLETGEKGPMGPIEFGKFQTEKNDAITSLEALEQLIDRNIPLGQNNMIRVGITYKIYKENLEKENGVFNQHILDIQDKLTNFRDQLVTYRTGLQQCQKRVSEFDATISAQEKDLVESKRRFEEQKIRLQDEEKTFQEVHDIYNGNVVAGTDDARKQEIQGRIDKKGANADDLWDDAGDAEPEAHPGEEPEEDIVGANGAGLPPNKEEYLAAQADNEPEDEIAADSAPIDDGPEEDIVGANGAGLPPNKEEYLAAQDDEPQNEVAADAPADDEPEVLLDGANGAGLPPQNDDVEAPADVPEDATNTASEDPVEPEVIVGANGDGLPPNQEEYEANQEDPAFILAQVKREIIL